MNMMVDRSYDRNRNSRDDAYDMPALVYPITYSPLQYYPITYSPLQSPLQYYPITYSPLQSPLQYYPSQSQRNQLSIETSREHVKAEYFTADNIFNHLLHKHQPIFNTGYYMGISIFPRNQKTDVKKSDVEVLIKRTNDRAFPFKKDQWVHCDAVQEIGNKHALSPEMDKWEKAAVMAEKGYIHWHGIIYSSKLQNLHRFVDKLPIAAKSMRKASIKADVIEMDESLGGLLGWMEYICKMNKREFDPEGEFVEI